MSRVLLSKCSGGDCMWECGFFFFQAEDGIRDLVRSRGLGDVYKRQPFGTEYIAIPQRTMLPDMLGSPNVKAHAYRFIKLSLIHI